MTTLLLNGLPVGSAGNFTVLTQLERHLRQARPDWRIVTLLTRGKPMHADMANGANGVSGVSEAAWAPPATAGRYRRQWWERRHLRKLCDAESVDAMFTLSGVVPSGLGRPAIAHLGDPWPYLPEAWGTGIDRLRARLLATLRKRAHRLAFERAAAIGFTSAWLRDVVCRAHGREPTGHVLYNGIPADWHSRPMPSLEGRRRAIVSVSHVGPYKRQAAVIGALAHPRLSDVHYHIAGECPPAYRTVLERQITDLGVTDRVTIEGRVSDARVVELLGGCRVYALPSVCESFGIGAIEAMSFGCPCVVADAAAVPEIVGDAAIKCSEASLPDALANVLDDDALAERLRQRGRENVQRFNWSTTAEQIAGLVESTLA